jgi:hypothetical protein
MTTPETVKAQIREAFAASQYPGDHRLRGSDVGDEPFELEREFRGKRDWQSLPPEFIDRAPNGLASALCFFSHEAFQFYLPAYLIADLEGKLVCHSPVFHLTHGLERVSASQHIDSRRHTGEKWSDYAKRRFQGLTPQQAAAIVSYLKYKRDSEDTLPSTRQAIEEALDSYWRQRAG